MYHIPPEFRRFFESYPQRRWTFSFNFPRVKPKNDKKPISADEVVEFYRKVNKARSIKDIIN